MATALGEGFASPDDRILVLEKSTSFPQRTWCLWTREDHAYDHLVSKRWSRLKFIGPERERTFELGEWEYQYIAGEDFFAAMHQRVAQFPNVEIRYEAIEGVEERNGKIQLKTGARAYESDMLYNSLPDPAISGNARFFLWQHFKGWFVKMDQPVFDSDCFTLMDFQKQYHPDGTSFFYVLPFSETEALVEFTVFSKKLISDEAYETAIQAYLHDHYEGVAFEVYGTEKGKIPMTDYPFAYQESRQILNIGGRAGMVKPTTGYAFKRIMADTRLLMAHQMGKRYAPPSRFRLYDKLLLRILYETPEYFAPIMERLFLNQPISRILRFLDESTALWEEALIFRKLPIGRFLQSLKDELTGSK